MTPDFWTPEPWQARVRSGSATPEPQPRGAAPASRRAAAPGRRRSGATWAGNGQDGQLARRQRRNQPGKAPRSSLWERGRIGPHQCRQEKLLGGCSETICYEPGQDARPGGNGMTCTATAGVLITACQCSCATDADCRQQLPGKALACSVRDTKGEKCCEPR